MNLLPSSQRHKPHAICWKRYEKQQLDHRVQIDVKFIEPLQSSRKPKYYQYTAIDDCTRLRVLRIYDRNNQKTAIQFVDYVRQKPPSRSRSSKPTTAPCSKPIPLAHPRPRHPTRLHQAGHTTTQRQSRTLTVSTTKNSTGSSTASSSTTPKCSTTNSTNGRTSTTSTDPTEHSLDKPHTNEYKRKQPKQPRPSCKPRPSVAHCALGMNRTCDLRFRNRFEHVSLSRF